MVLGHFPKRAKGGEAKVILDSLTMAGIDPDRVVEITVGQHSPLHGALPSWHFKAHSAGKLPFQLVESRQLARRGRRIDVANKFGH
ncbi:MAG TPA: hypothetical protein VM910_25930 [Bradyrhizobium sp.]|nr:hypothetical protein [Bradyrhizobium sp.]